MRTICNIFILVFAVVIAVFAMGFSPTVFAAEGDLIWTQTSNPSSGYDSARAIAVDSTGVYVAGMDSGYAQWRIEKRSLSTGAIIWTQTSNPSSGADVAYAIAVDSTGVYVAGFDTSLGNFNYQWHIEKRSPSTGAIIWTQTSNPSSSDDIAYAIAVDSTGVYVAGMDSGYDQWRIEKRSLSTGAIIWTQTNNPTSLGVDIAYAIAVDSTGVYVAGCDDINGLYGDDGKWRIEKRSPSTGAIIWTQTSDPTPYGYENAYAIAVNSTGVYIAGQQQTLTPWRIEKRNPSTGAVVWIQSKKVLGYMDIPAGIAVDSAHIYVAGRAESSDDEYGDEDYISSKKWHIEKRNGSDGTVVWNQTIDPSAGKDRPFAIAVDGTGMYIAGHDSLAGNYNEQWRIEKREIALTICTGPFAVSWTDPTITSNTTKIRKVHIDEMRTQINNRRVDAGLTNYSWTDPTITANTTKIRKVHIDEMRTAISQVYTTCGQAAPSWTDSTITANTTKIRKVHIDELRSAVGNAK